MTRGGSSARSAEAGRARFQREAKDSSLFERSEYLHDLRDLKIGTSRSALTVKRFAILPKSKKLLIGGAPDFFVSVKCVSTPGDLGPVAARRERPSRADHFRPFTGYGRTAHCP